MFCRSMHLVALCLAQEVPPQLGVQLAELGQRHLLGHQLLHQSLVLRLQGLHLQPNGQGLGLQSEKAEFRVSVQKNRV